MKLKIDTWIENNKFSMVVNILLKDSSLCYKAGAYRASLLFSYLGFLTILKERIISANKPQIYSEHNWGSLILKLKNEDQWEKAVFESTQQKAKINQAKEITQDVIFSIKDDIREQIKYWKNRRNDCAHFKENNIDYYHIESFWAFMESNLPKITIEGGLNTLINKIKDHFDYTLTPPNKDFSHLIRDIEHSVEPSKLDEFWDSFITPSRWNSSLSISKRKFLKECFRISSDTVKNSIISKLREKYYYMMGFLDTYPELLIRFNLNDKEIRKFWTVDLNDSSNPIGLYTSLLRNALIPKEEINDANKLVIKLLKEYSPTLIEHNILNNNLFFKAFKLEIIENSKFIGYKSYLWVNEKADIISGFIEHYPADKDIIIKLSEHYNQGYNSEWLLKRLDNVLEEGKKITLDYKTIIQSENIVLPESLNKYFA